MSRFSGVCDLCDSIAGSAGWYDKNGKLVKIGDSGVGIYYSDEYQDFLVFKKMTGGVIYQHHKVKVTEWNQEEVKEYCPGFDFTELTRTIPDKRCKNGSREEKYFVYHYYGKNYTLEELNKRGVYITLDIRFNTLLDLLPYYPYVVSMSAMNPDKWTVFVSDKPEPISTRDMSFKSGGTNWHSWKYYADKLQEHYREVVLNYYNPEGYEQVDELIFWKATDKDYGELEGKYLGAVKNGPIDENFPVEWVIEKEDKTHWTSPKVVGSRMIEMSKEDFEHFLGKKIKVKYIKDHERRRILG